MAVQATQLYNSGYAALMADAESPTNATTGEFLWVLVTNAYTPLLTHTTGADFGGDELSTGDCGPINATTPIVTAISTASYFQAGSAAGASIVTIGPDTVGGIEFRYLALVRPVSPPTYAPTAELIFYIDLTGEASNDTLAIGESVTVNMTSSGWFKMVQS